MQFVRVNPIPKVGENLIESAELNQFGTDDTGLSSGFLQVLSSRATQ